MARPRSKRNDNARLNSSNRALAKRPQKSPYSRKMLELGIGKRMAAVILKISEIPNDGSDKVKIDASWPRHLAADLTLHSSMDRQDDLIELFTTRGGLT